MKRTLEVISRDKEKGMGLSIHYGFHASPFGQCLLGVTKRGVCHLSFYDPGQKRAAERRLRQQWPQAIFIHDDTVTAPIVRNIFANNLKHSSRPLRLLIKGTDFQIKVWKELLNIPAGRVTSYAALARSTKSPRAVRAVGTACGANNIALLIPCHRVLTTSGKLSGYRWGTARKEAILAWEAVRH